MPVNEEELRRALILVRDLRLAGIVCRIDPKAMRIALKWLLLVDDHFAKGKLTPEQEKDLDKKAKELFDKSLKEWKKEKKVLF